MIQIDLQTLESLPSGIPLSKSALTRFLNRARKLVDLSGAVEVLLTSDAELKRLNRNFRGKNKTTDILSFPVPPQIAEHHAGDLAISLETAARQAGQYGHSLNEELRILILHGLLHLSGMDHETDLGEMAARESSLRATLKLPANLIARVSTTNRTTNRTTNNEQRTTDNGQRPSSKKAAHT
jgi:probable rRNA maturation factor